jgi:hypothetical protein
LQLVSRANREQCLVSGFAIDHSIRECNLGTIENSFDCFEKYYEDNYTLWLPTKYFLLQAIIDVPVTLEANQIINMTIYCATKAYRSGLGLS